MNLSKISIGLTIGGALFAFYGMLKLIIYYAAFGIEILYFIELSELFLASLEGITKCFLYLFPIYVFLSFFIKNDFLASESETYKEFIKKNKILFILIFILGILLSGQVYFALDSLFYSFHSRIQWSFFGIVILAIFAPRAVNKALTILGKPTLKGHGQLFVFLLLFLSIFYLGQALNDINLVGSQGFFESTNIYLNDGTVLKGDSSHYYIGNTNKYLFFHNEESSSTSVYKMTDIRRIDF